MDCVKPWVPDAKAHVDWTKQQALELKLDLADVKADSANERGAYW